MIIKISTYIILLFFIIFSSLALILHHYGIFLNVSASIPIGFYRCVNQPLKRNLYVSLCPPDTHIFKVAKMRGYIGTGFCKGGYGYIFKKIKGLGGDNISINKSGVFVNGIKIKASRPLKLEGDAKLSFVKFSNYKLKPKELLLMGENDPISFDSRYFGVIDKEQVISVIYPIYLLSDFKVN